MVLFWFYLFLINSLRRKFDFHLIFVLQIDWYADQVEFFFKFQRVIKIQILLVIWIHCRQTGDENFEIYQGNSENEENLTQAVHMTVQNKFKYTEASAHHLHKTNNN